MSNTNSTPPNLEDLLGGSVPNSDPSPAEKKTPPPQDLNINDLLADQKKSSSPEKPSSLSGPSLSELLGGEEEKNTPIVNFSENATEKEVPVSADNNIFQKALNEKGEEKESHLIDAIENYAPEFEIHESNEVRVEDPFILMHEREERIFREQESKWKKIMITSQSLAVFSVLFGIIVFFVFSFLLDTPEKGLLGQVVSNNYGIDRDTKKNTERDLQGELSVLKKEVRKNQEIIDSLENNTLLDVILSDRIDWLKALKNITSVRNESQATEESRYIFLENYSTKGKMENGKIPIVITGKVYSSNNIFQKISKLLDSLNESTHFSGATMNRFDKNYSGREYSMSFSLELDYYPLGKLAEKIANTDTTEDTKK